MVSKMCAAIVLIVMSLNAFAVEGVECTARKLEPGKDENVAMVLLPKTFPTDNDVYRVQIDDFFFEATMVVANSGMNSVELSVSNQKGRKVAHGKSLADWNNPKFLMAIDNWISPTTPQLFVSLLCSRFKK